MEFEDELQSWHEGEVAGAAFFGELADSARDDGEAEKWRLLGSLESSMAGRLSAACVARSITLSESTSSVLEAARKMARRSWETNMENLVPQLEVAVAEIRAAATEAPVEFSEVAEDYVATTCRSTGRRASTTRPGDRSSTVLHAIGKRPTASPRSSFRATQVRTIGPLWHSTLRRTCSSSPR